VQINDDDIAERASHYRRDLRLRVGLHSKELTPKTRTLNYSNFIIRTLHVREYLPATGLHVYITHRQNLIFYT